MSKLYIQSKWILATLLAVSKGDSELNLSVNSTSPTTLSDKYRVHYKVDKYNTVFFMQCTQ